MNIAARAGRIVLLATSLLTAPTMQVLADSAGVPPALLQHLHWRSIGPFRGGRVLAVQGAPDDRERFYFGAVNGGVWRTDDAGRTWQPIFDAAPVGSIGALAVSPSAPKTLYVGTGEADMRSDIAQGVGMFRSGDGGQSWAPIGLGDTQQIARILVDPRNPYVLLVAALGHPYGPNAERGVFRSENGGRGWTKTLFHDADTGAIDLAASPTNPDIVYAALWQTRRPPWSVYPPSNGPGSGLYKSTDGGRNWVQLTGHGLPASPARIGLATTPARPDRVYALIDVREGSGAGLYRSDDAGANWQVVSQDKRISERAWYFSGITADPANADIVYVCDTIILRSSDGGAHFLPIKGDPTGDDFHTLWIDPRDSARRILGVDQGALVTLNGGQTWSSWFNQPTGQFYHVATDNRFPYRVYGAQQDSGAASVASSSDNPFDGIGLQEFHESAAGGESDNIAPDPADPDSVYGGRVEKLDLRSGQVQNLDPTLAFPDDYRGTWTLPLLFGPQDHALYFGNQRVFRTKDGGQNWLPISADLTRADPAVPATLDAATADDVKGMGRRRGVVYAIAPSPMQSGLIWAGTDDGLVWHTQDDGAHWQDVTPPGLQAWSKIGTIEASHFDVATAYLAVDRHRLDDQAPYILRTQDGGTHWADIVAGLPATGGPNSVNVVREDTQERNLLFAGTEHGAYVSFDTGGHWQELQSGLPRTSVRDMTIHGNDLVIATHGRGFYILDDIASLRALAKDPGTGTRLFPPQDAVRLHKPQFTGTPMPKDEPMAANPPVGAIIDYVLATSSQGKVVIDILDQQGQPMRHFSNENALRPRDLAALPVAPEWLPQESRPEATPGSHRFVWDLRTTKPDVLNDGDPPPQAVLAPPGVYKVVLRVDGQSMQQTFRIVADPRVKLGNSEFQAEFTLARQIESARVTCRMALHNAAVLTAGRKDAASRASLAALIGLPGAGKDAAPPPTNGLTAISDRLDRLAGAVDGADAAPTPDARKGYEQARSALDAALATMGEEVK